ncbi:MAG: hypothetical protein DMD82_08010 [Candidatus Rokuibacteriota bacterium]|nr:MAG: hypothetical protein DMD82_08010 [Candidatus Rokubacteria bacterium]
MFSSVKRPCPPTRSRIACRRSESVSNMRSYYSTEAATKTQHYPVSAWRPKLSWTTEGTRSITTATFLTLSGPAMNRRGSRPDRVIGVVAALVLQGLTTVAVAQEPAPRETPAREPPAPSESLVLPPLLVTAPPPVSSSSEQLIPGKTFEVRPQGRPADVLRLIPGLVISQHQGGGKAEQYLLRGFDADHGTDIAVFVDGLPVNLRSHAHGQGYADLHFLIPETVKLVDALKGPYFVEYGDFDTGGVVNFVTKDFVEENTLEVAGGSFNTQRYLALISPTRDARSSIQTGMTGSTSSGRPPPRWPRTWLCPSGAPTTGPSGAAPGRFRSAPCGGASSTASVRSTRPRAATPSGPTSTWTIAGGWRTTSSSPSTRTARTTR